MFSVQEELVREGVLNGQGKPWRDRTECLRGHPYSPENTMWRRHGARRCRKCQRAAGRRWYATRGAALRRRRRENS